MSVPKTGGTPATLASNQYYPTDIAVNDTTVFWTTTWTPGAVMSVSLDGGTPQTLASSQSGPAHVVLNATSLYWTNIESPVGLIQAQLNGSMASTLVGEGSALIAFGGLALDSASVFYDDQDGLTVVSIPLLGGQGTTIATGQMVPTGAIAVDETSVYWAVSDYSTPTAALVSAPRGGGGSPTTLYTQSGNLEFGSIAVDSTSLYWSDLVDGGNITKLTPK
jgi:hypothetical protein